MATDEEEGADWGVVGVTVGDTSPIPLGSWSVGMMRWPKSSKESSVTMGEGVEIGKPDDEGGIEFERQKEVHI